MGRLRGGAARQDLVAEFHEAMSDDLDVPRALHVVDKAADAGAGTTVRELATTDAPREAQVVADHRAGARLASDRERFHPPEVTSLGPSKALLR